MTKRWRLCLLLLLLLVTGLLLVPQVRWPVYGWLRGEAFYQGMPASWWAKEIEESYHSEKPRSGSHLPRTWYADPPSPQWYEVWKRRSDYKYIIGGPLLNGNAEAFPVLLALLRSESGKARQLAVSGLLTQDKQRSDVVPALLAAIEDSDDEVRQDAIAALLHMDPEAAAKAGVK